MNKRKTIIFIALSMVIGIFISSFLLSNVHTLAFQDNSTQESFNALDRQNWRWTPVELISTESTIDLQSPDFTVDTSGNIHIVWEEVSDYASSGSDRDIFYKKWDSSTKLWSTIEVVSFVSTTSSFRPSVDVDNLGNAYVVWNEYEDYNSAGVDEDIFFRIRNASTSSWMTTKVVSTESTSESDFPVIAVDISSNAHIAWLDSTNYNLSGSDLDIFYKKWDSTTQTFTTTEVVSIISSGNAYEPSIEVDNIGNIFLVWEDRTFSIDQDIFFNKWDKQLNSWLGTEILSDYTTFTSHYPEITSDSMGNIHVVWSSQGTSSNGLIKRIFYKKWDSTSQKWFLTEVIRTVFNEDYVNRPSISSDSSGNIYVVLEHTIRDSTGSTILDNDIEFKYYDVSSSSWSTETIISLTEIDNPGYPSLTVDNLGHIHVIWYDDFDYFSSGSDRDIFYRKFIGPPPAPILGNSLLNSSTEITVNLDWDDVYGATAYYIYRSTDYIWSLDSLSPIETTISSDFIDTLISSNTYYYTVVAGNFAGNSTFSNCENVEIKIPSPIPLQSPELAIIIPNPSDITNIFLDWDDIDGAAEYYIYRSDSYIWSVESLTPILTVTSSSYIDTLSSEGYYFYVIVATDGLTNSTLSNCEYVEYTIPTLFENLFTIGLAIGFSALFAIAIFRRRNNSS